MASDDEATVRLRTPEQWCAEYGLEIHDPDGWRGSDAPPWDQPIGLAEFADRYALCTVDMVAGDRQRFDRDTRAVRDPNFKPQETL
jgi:hypothetical protein